MKATWSIGVTGNNALAWHFLDGTPNPDAKAFFLPGRPATAQGLTHVDGGSIRYDNPERLLADLELVCKAMRERLGIIA